MLGDKVDASTDMGVGTEVATEAGDGGGALTCGDGDAVVGVSKGMPAPMGTAFSLKPLLCMPIRGVESLGVGESCAGIRSGVTDVACVTPLGVSETSAGVMSKNELINDGTPPLTPAARDPCNSRCKSSACGRRAFAAVSNARVCSSSIRMAL